MPTILSLSGFRFFFYSNEGNEPCHIHVRKGDGYGKIRLLPTFDEDYYYGFTEKERKKIRNIVEEHAEYIIEKWNEYFG